MNNLLKTLRKKYTPEILVEPVNFVNKLNKRLKKGKAMLGGSVAQETNLPGQHDADVFVIYDDKIDYEDLKNAIKEYDYLVVHGSRDYFQIKNNIVYEIIPVLKVSKGKKPLNVADMSPLHVSYFQKKTNSLLKSDIRVAKALFKANNLYGAESYVKGFSGHVINILIIYYGSFENLLKNAIKWKEKTVIDIEKQLKDPLMEMDKSKLESPLIVVDPVYKYRNAAAALSKENFMKFKKLASSFLKNPSEEFFIKKSLTEEKGIFLKFTPLDGSDDVSGAKILKIKEYLENKLNDYGFKTKVVWSFDERLILLKPKIKELPKKFVKQGPPLNFQEHVSHFKQKYGKTFVEDNLIKAEVERKYLSIEEYLKKLLTNKYVKERCKNIQIMV